VTLTEGAGVTIEGDFFVTSGESAIAGIVKTATDIWTAYGDLGDASVLNETYSMLPTEAEFNAVARDNNDRYAGSGFVEWGKHYVGGSGTWSPINQGIWTDTDNPDYLLFGETGAGVVASDCTSKTIAPYVNVNGVVQKVSQVSTNATTQKSEIYLPPASADSSITERQDLMFLETWHEDISTKDIVYPLGNVQSLLATDPATGLTTVNGTFSGYTTYSLFGNWQSASDLIGKGVIWSTMTEANKKLFIADQENNMYLAPDGSIIQVRYRIRAVEGMGADWIGIDPQSSQAWMQYQNVTGERLTARGALTSSVDYFPTSGADFLYASVLRMETDSRPDGVKCGNGGYTLNTNQPTVAYKGLCFAIPIALVSRRNQGAFHPVWNPQGAGGWRNTTNNNTVGWYAPDFEGTPASAADCFFFGSPTANLPHGDGSGFIASAKGSYRPDDKFYDAIYEGDVQDLRNSAHKQDLKRTLEREFNKMIAGEFRGFENATKGLYEVETAATNTTNFITAGTNHFPTLVVGDYLTVWDSISGQYIRHKTTVVSAASSQFADNYGRVNGKPILYTAKTEQSTKEILWCDIVGDPADYPADWVSDGVMGNALLVGEEGEDYLDTGTYTNIGLIKLSRKAKEGVQILRSDDGGGSWTPLGTVSIGTDNQPDSGSGTGGAVIFMVFYLTEASPFELADNAEVLSLGDVEAGNASETNKGNLLGILINKVPTAAEVGTLEHAKRTLTEYCINVGILAGTASDLPVHNPFALVGSNNPALKVLPYLTRENGKLFLQAVYKEMKFDVSWGDDNKFNIVDNESTTTDDNAKVVIIGQKRTELPFFIHDGE
jgi:hypothetical protein